MRYEHIVHGFEPVYDSRSKVLILGSLPSVKSREQSFYYGHPRNRFWQLLAKLCGCPLPVTVSDKRFLLLENRIAVWDVISECDIIGSSDTSIRNVVPADISPILAAADIGAIFTNGSAAYRIYRRYQQPLVGREAVCLPSTSPANAAFSFERLLEAWSAVKKYT